MKKYLVIGLGRFGRTLARELSRMGGEVLALDRNHDLVNRLAPDVALALAADARDREVLVAQSAAEVDSAIVAIGEEFESTVLVTAHLVDLGVPQIVVRAATPTQKQILERLGAHMVVMPHDEMAVRLARALHVRGVVDFVELPEGYCLKQLRVPAAFVGHTLSDLNIRQRERVLVIRIRREKSQRGRNGELHVRETLIAIPDGDTILQEGDLLSVIGPEEAVERLGR